MDSNGEKNPRYSNLDNPKRVERVRDHGEKHYSEDYPAIRRDISLLSDETAVRTFLKDLNKAKVRYHSDDSKFFIPRGRFRKIATPERILSIVDSFKSSHFQDKSTKQRQSIAQLICFGSGPRRPALKIFAAGIASKNGHHLLKHINDGLNDECLPLNVDHTNSEYHLQCQCGNPQHTRAFEKDYDLADDRETFEKWTKSLMAPYIKFEPGLHSHYKFNTGTCLPIETEKIVAPSQPRTSRGSDKSSANGSYGGFSDVYKVKLFECHCKFIDNRLRNFAGHYALKRLTSHKPNDFRMELSSLLFSADNDKDRSEHMIQVLATFEEFNPANKTSTFYLLFDWAEGDLEGFWRDNVSLVCDANHCLWMAEQFYGLAQALEAVHNDRRRLQLPEEEDATEIYGRHGDIKPSNILWFRLLEKEQKLALADFGLGRLHTKFTRSKQDPATLGTTATYRPPEFDLPDGLVGPTSDVFSLGCVYLEYISWFLLGHDSIDKFSDERLAQDIHTFQADTFFIIVDAPGHVGHKIAKIKPEVKSWIKKLKGEKACSWYLCQMLELIEDEMLVGNKDGRIRAANLVKELEILHKSCRQESSFYTKHWKDGKSPMKLLPIRKAGH